MQGEETSRNQLTVHSLDLGCYDARKAGCQAAMFTKMRHSRAALGGFFSSSDGSLATSSLKGSELVTGGATGVRSSAILDLKVPLLRAR